MRPLHILLLLISVTFLSSCLNSDANIAKRFELLYFSPNVAQHIVVGSDSVRVTDIKFSVSEFTLTNNEGIVLQSVELNRKFIYDYDIDSFGDRIVFSSDIGFELNNFTSYGMNIVPVADNEPIFDTDFFGTENNYSIIIRGSYNDEDFVIRSSSTLDLDWDFDPIVLSDNDETIFLRTIIDIEDLFTSDSNTLLNPTVNEDVNSILSNFESNLDLLPFADSIFQ